MRGNYYGFKWTGYKLYLLLCFIFISILYIFGWDVIIEFMILGCSEVRIVWVIKLSKSAFEFF